MHMGGQGRPCSKRPPRQRVRSTNLQPGTSLHRVHSHGELFCRSFTRWGESSEYEQTPGHTGVFRTLLQRPVTAGSRAVVKATLPPPGSACNLRCCVPTLPSQLLRPKHAPKHAGACGVGLTASLADPAASLASMELGCSTDHHTHVSFMDRAGGSFFSRAEHICSRHCRCVQCTRSSARAMPCCLAAGIMLLLHSIKSCWLVAFACLSDSRRHVAQVCARGRKYVCVPVERLHARVRQQLQPARCPRPAHLCLQALQAHVPNRGALRAC